jgi:serine/threonine-protein kinase
MKDGRLLHYRILGKLGAGAQGTVYKALDTKLGRTVVLKVLPPELTANPTSFKRFEREARLASALDHPNICMIFDFNEAAGVHFIVMQYVDGQNVRQLVNGKPLELRGALSVAIQVADALAAAHERGIIHRDVKAGNVMVTKAGQVKVLDFGLAKLLGEPTAHGESTHNTELTELGIPYGTATYAAPEQATGGKVDHRADIFSTGVLLYEMLTGIWPFQGKTSVEVRYAVLHDTPRPVAEFRSDAPPRIQQILERALAKRPEQRYQRMSEMRDDLRAVLRDVLTGAGASIEDTFAPVAPRHQSQAGGSGFGSTFKRWLRNITGASEPSSQPPAASTVPPRAMSATHDTPQTSLPDGQKSIAILPFRNLSGETEVSFYEFSLADAVITELARLRSLVVRPSSMIVKYQGQQVDPLQAGREMSVGAVLAASFLRAGDKLRVNAQLLDVDTGALLWSDRMDAAAADIISVQDMIAQHIVDGLRVELTADEQVGLAQRASSNAEAYEEYLRGRDRMGRYIYHTLANEDVEAAIAHFRRALDLDAGFALAHCALGGCYANRVIKGMGDAEDYDRAEEEFNKGLALDPKNNEARMHMIFIYLWRGERQKARAEVERLRHEAPNDTGVHFISAYFYRLDGEYEKALRSLERMLRLNPNERVVVSYNRARIFMYQGRYSDALLELEQGAAVEPDHPFIKTFTAVWHYRQGQPEKAVEMLQGVLASHPEMDGIRPHLAIALSMLGRHEEARAQLTERVKQIADADHDTPYWLASAYALEGMKDEAFEWLEHAIDIGNENLPWFVSNPAWADLRTDERFQTLMRRIERDQTKARANME